MLVGVAALSMTLPSLAAAQGRGHGNGHSVRADQPRGNAGARVNTQQPRRNTRTRVTSTDRNGNGIADRSERRVVDRNRARINDRTGNRYGGDICPPGLENRTPACVPPGQARRMFREGQRVPINYGAFNSYTDIPEQFRQQFNIPTGQNYIYRDNSVYVVDPRTRLVTDIISLIRR
jgi:hypothetical protein